MSAIVSLIDQRAWFKIRHPYMKQDLAYRALGYIPPYSETGWAYLTFFGELGHTFAIRVDRCTRLPNTCEIRHIDHTLFHRELTETERLFPWAERPTIYNPDLLTDL